MLKRGTLKGRKTATARRTARGGRFPPDGAYQFAIFHLQSYLPECAGQHSAPTADFLFV
jgi:hypothetical protein